MALTYNTMVDTLEALTVTGVTRKYTDGPPQALNTADLPSQWVEVPAGDQSPIAVGTGSNLSEMSCDLVIAYEAAGQGQDAATNFSGLVDLMDNLVTALRALSLGIVRPSWSIRQGIIARAGGDYWGIVTTVTTRG